LLNAPKEYATINRKKKKIKHAPRQNEALEPAYETMVQAEKMEHQTATS
jgi:hypothetical protein